MKIYLDNCCFNRPYDQPTQTRIVTEALAKMEIQLAISEGKLDLAVSHMLVAENTRCPNPMAKVHNLRFMHEHAKSYVGSKRMEELMPMIREIMDAGIKRADATHIACAIDSGCDYLITTDDRMLKYKDNRITIITPNDMLYIMEGLR